MKRNTKTQTAPEMRHSWLVQRLSKPRASSLLGGADNPFAFGGGLVNGGLSKDAMSLLRPIFSFDYMGAAEFEFGAVPEALSKIADNAKSLVARSITIPLADVEKHWSDKTRKAPGGEATVYILCQQPHSDEVDRRIRGWARTPNESEFDTKETVGLSTILRPGDYTPDTCGWLELVNGFMFFTDREMWAATCSLFGVEVDSAAA